MAKEKRIGIIYSFDEDWIAGAYYIRNLISSLNHLPQEEQMTLYILTHDKPLFNELKKITGYSKLKFIQYKKQYNKVERVINKISTLFFKRKLCVQKIKLDWVFPMYSTPKDLCHIKELIFWIPDFQELHLPDFFSEDDIKHRHLKYEKIVELNHPIVFSSKASLNDFKTLFPDSKNETNVIHFAVTHPDLSQKRIDVIKQKYGIKGDYFISPNQLWQHKNQTCVIEAVKTLKDSGIDVKMIFTGKESDYRNPEYSSYLKKKVIDYQLQNEIVFLGFIDREEQLLLMKNSIAVIQPSLFEGWSTSVEDAKALNLTIIASNISVHEEQLQDKGYYFSPNDFNELAQKMLFVINNPKDKLAYDLDYTQNIKRFASNLKLLINKNLSFTDNE